ncbi:IclR family transcriptional regulator [Georgenia sp. AZ-5]|uniref:IclR family transcriptional regulator n=1 Tax=Georgenia sp. AZ-5 TaxID=3367526 RepID=UPI00375467CD
MSTEQAAEAFGPDSVADVNAPGRRGPANASEKTLLVLEAALTHRRFTDVVEATGLAKATTHRILTTLIDHGYLVADRAGGYMPGPKILSMAGHALERIDISAIAQPFVDKLVENVHCTVHVGAANGDEVIYLVRTDSDKPYRMPSRVGHTIPMHSSGIGKVILASWPEDAVARFVTRAGLAPRTEHTITTLPQLRAELAWIRQHGYALDREENVPGVACVAAPIHDHTGVVKYGVSISTLALEHTPEQVEAMSADVLATASAISAALGYRPR